MKRSILQKSVIKFTTKTFYEIDPGLFVALLDEGQRQTGRHDIQHNDSQHNDIQHNVTQHRGLTCDTQHTNIMYQVLFILSVIML